jgi:hypothetical protein
MAGSLEGAHDLAFPPLDGRDHGTNISVLAILITTVCGHIAANGAAGGTLYNHSGQNDEPGGFSLLLGPHHPLAGRRGPEPPAGYTKNCGNAYSA